jgi:NDP-sugar pyrophosphorylase family protein
MVEQLVASGEWRDGYIRLGDALVHVTARIADDAVLVGPVLVGPGAQVLPAAAIAGPASIGRDATIRGGAFVSRSAIWRRSVVSEQAVADRCIVGDDACVAPRAHLFREVIAADRRTDSAGMRASCQTEPTRELVSLELYKRFVRGLVGTKGVGRLAAE